MGGYYAVDDTGSTYSQGQTTAGSAGDARSAGTQAQTAAEAVTPGSRHGASVIKGAAADFGTDCKQAAETMANGAEKLGGDTSGTAVTVENASNDATSVQNGNTSLNRGVNASNGRVLAV